MNIEEITAEILKLDLKARAKLAERILRSLDDLSEEENRKLWAEEAQRRHEAWEAGKAVTYSAEEVFRDARNRLT